MKTKAIVAVALFLLSTVVANAQSVPSLPFPQGALRNLTSQMLPHTGNGPLVQQPSSMRAGTLNGLGNVPIGFNVVHATNCVWQTPDLVNNVEFILSQEGPVFALVNSPNAAVATVASACANGNFIGVNVFDSAGDFNEIFTFPVK